MKVVRVVLIERIWVFPVIYRAPIGRSDRVRRLEWTITSAIRRFGEGSGRTGLASMGSDATHDACHRVVFNSVPLRASEPLDTTPSATALALGDG